MTVDSGTQKARRRPFRGKARLLEMDQRKGFLAILRRLPGPQSGNVTPKEWTVLSGVYRGLKSMVPPDVWKATWAEAKEYRTGLRPEKATSELAKAFALYQRHADFQRAVWARDSGYNAERERRRREKDPEGYKARATERQRQRRARLKAEKAEAAAYLEIVVPYTKPVEAAAPYLETAAE